MSDKDALRRDARQVLLAQVIVTLLLAGGFGFADSLSAMLAALYGGVITILITAWLARRVRQAGQTKSAENGLVVIYSSSVVRYAAVVVLVGAGIGLLGLPPLPLLSAFAVTQFGFLAAMLTPKGVTGAGR